ncbi:MAG: FixH family protein [Sphingobium sp.]
MQASKGLRGVHVLFMTVSFFALIIAADTYFIVRAVNSFPGEQVRNSYVLGLDYNREVEERARQAELGWIAEAGIVSDNGAVFIVRLVDAVQSPVTGLHMTATYFVAGGGREEHKISLIESAPGEYRAAIPAADTGRAEFRIAASRAHGDATIFQASKTAVIP